MSLPDKLSDLIDLALSDMEKVEKDKLYTVDLEHFHQPRYGVCHVCFAGCAIAKTLNVPVTSSLYPFQCDEDVNKKLRALDSIASGNVHTAFWHLKIDDAKFASYLNKRFDRRCKKDGIIGWEDMYLQNPDRFKEYMRRFSHSLKQREL